jgi:hypothetical protein
VQPITLRAGDARDEDAHQLITCWKSGLFYIYSTPSIPTTETTHGFYEENTIEEKGAKREEAPHCTTRSEKGTPQGPPRREEDPPEGATQALRD